MSSLRSLVKSSDASGIPKDTNNQQTLNGIACKNEYERIPRDRFSLQMTRSRPRRHSVTRASTSPSVHATASCHCRDILATSLGTLRRGIKRCANTLTLLGTQEITSPPPFANDYNAPRATSSGDW